MTSNLRLGIIGAGYIANVIAEVLAHIPELSLMAVASRQRDHAEAFARKYDVPHVFDTWSNLLNSNHVDAVYVATPTAIREEICVAAAGYKKHILAEKPFASLASFQRIANACKTNQLALMDATHFPHHPRTRQLKQEIQARIGDLVTIHACFYFPSPRENNIRYDPAQEPTGAIGDMAWYAMRAVAEFTSAEVLSAHGFALNDKQTGALIQGVGALQLSDGITSTWDVGYNVGTCVMDLRLLGRLGLLSLDDFVLDWKDGFPIKNPAHDVGFTQRVGLVTPSGFERVRAPSQFPATVDMLCKFCELVKDPSGADALASIEIAEKTQRLLDAITAHLEVRSA